MREFMDIFAEAGIDYIFWPHATQDDVARAASGIGGPRIHPFPLYPVQVEQATEAAAPEADGAKRAHLFSFIGARADKHYPSQTRNHILDLLADDPRGFIRGRDGWFYHKVVYEKQVFSVHKAAPDAQLIEQDQAAQFRAVLEQSTFSLCPAGTGPNSIRLWESIGAGSIPVILADDWAPPGNRALWEAAAVFRPETPEAVSALPDELEAMARDPALLAAKRQAMRQLWLLYGPDSFVFDIHKLMQRLAVGQGAAAPEAAALPEPEPAPVSEPGALSPDQARQRLVRLAADLLLLPQVQAGLAREAEAAQALLDPADPVRRHFDQVRALALPSGSWATVPAGVPAATAPLPRPALRRGAVPRVHLFGHHSNRTPLSYEPIVREIPGRLTFVDRPEAADVLLTGFNRDFVEAADQLADLAGRSPRQKRLVLSEEPLWDTLWSGGFVDRDRQLKNGVGYRFLNHENSDIFDFTHFPYFPLSDDDLLATYAMRIGAVARKSPREMLESWKAARVPLAFFAEHRKGATYDKPVPERDIWTLCSLRTELAEICAARVPGTLCVGKGWREQKRRQELPSWHLDKLAQLTGRSAICSGIENTHQRHYVTEKVFDAFAVGAVPIYYASPSHRVFEFVPQGAMINIFGLDAGAAAERIAAFTPDPALAELWIETAQTLAKRFGDVRLIHEERRRFALHSLQAVLDLA
ncbi:MAG: exostosin family protein [Cypionkella sp.]|nr:exostosin family protein [Cypionkella sp.]